MRRFTIYILMMLAVGAVPVHAQLFPQLGGQRAGISALTFLKIDPSPRSAAMGGAQVSVQGDPFAAYWNPAGITALKDWGFGASNTFWAAGINYAYLSAVKPFKFGHMGLNIASLTTGAMERRTEFQPEGTGEYFYASNTAVGLTYAKQLTDFFSFGASLKYINESLAEYRANTAVLDLGFLYKTDIKDLSFAVVMQSFGTDSKLKGNYNPDGLQDRTVVVDKYPAPTEFKLGISMVPLKKDDMSLTTAIQLNHPNDNAENIRLGVEYEYRQILYLRAGYKINVKDQNFPTAGLGVRTRVGRHPLYFDYAMDPTRYLGFIHRIGVNFNINREERSNNP